MRKSKGLSGKLLALSAALFCCSCMAGFEKVTRPAVTEIIVFKKPSLVGESRSSVSQGEAGGGRVKIVVTVSNPYKHSVTVQLVCTGESLLGGAVQRSFDVPPRTDRQVPLRPNNAAYVVKPTCVLR